MQEKLNTRMLNQSPLKNYETCLLVYGQCEAQSIHNYLSKSSKQRLEPLPVRLDGLSALKEISYLFFIIKFNNSHFFLQKKLRLLLNESLTFYFKNFIRHSIFIILMEAKQKLINFLAIVSVTYLLYNLNKNINSVSLQHQNYINIMRSIGEGESISDSMIADIVALSSKNHTITDQQTPLCFIRAFFEIVIKENLDPQNLFKIFQDSKAQFNNIQKCSHYYSLLISRTLLINQTKRSKFISILEELERQSLQINMTKSRQTSQICVYMNGFNNEDKIKEQIKMLASQIYKNSFVLVQDDGSSDNTPIFAKYTIEELNQKGIKNIVFSQNSNRKGIFKGLNDFIKRCNSDSIVIVLSNNDTLLSSNSLSSISQAFKEKTTKVAILGAITSPHFNINYAQNYNALKNNPNPIIAFKKQVLVEFYKLIELSTTFQGLEKSLLAYYLAQKLAQQQQVAIKYINDAYISRQQQRGESIIARLQQLQKLFSKA